MLSAYPYKMRQTNSELNFHSESNQKQQLHRPSTAASFGGFKSSTVKLEVELAERLNEIDRSRVSVAGLTHSIGGSWLL